MNEVAKRELNNKRGKIRLFISQPFTGCDETSLQKQREALHKVFAAFIGEKIDNVELINQLNPDDPYDVRRNFRYDKEQDFYRFCRSIGLLGKATDIVLYGDWENSRGCKLEVEILKKYGIHIIDQKLLMAFCIKNKMLEEFEVLWPEDAKFLKDRCVMIKDQGVAIVDPELMDDEMELYCVVALTSDAVADDEIIISHYSQLSFDIPAGVKAYVPRHPGNGELLKLTPKLTWDYEKFPPREGLPDIVYVSPNTASKLLMETYPMGDAICLTIPLKPYMNEALAVAVDQSITVLPLKMTKSYMDSMMDKYTYANEKNNEERYE